MLILGGDSRSKDIVLCAKSLGVHTIVADYYDFQRSPAKLIADEYWNQDVFNTEEVVRLIREHKVDGVLTGFSDSYLLKYNEICTAAGLPCYATKNVFETTLDKALFKQLCIDNDVPTVPSFDLETFDPNIISDAFKVMVKPVDNSGSRGIKVCSRPEDFQACLDYALSFSQKKKVVIERFMEYDSFSCSYTIQDGELSLSTMNDRGVHKVAGAGAVTVSGIYPSKYLDSYLEKMDRKVQSMYEKLGVTNGVLFIQGFTDGNEYYFFEMGYRLGGTAQYRYTSAVNGINSLHMMMTHALTGKMPPEDQKKDDAAFRKPCCTLTLLSKGGRVARNEGVEEARRIPQVLYIENRYKVGDVVPVTRTTTQFHVRCYIMADDVQQMKDLIDHLQNSIQAYDENGEPMMITHFDTEKLTFGDNVFR